ncbi:hypothetical protein AVEN_143972-1 [Araneus ventricosus]|uniref:Uncharacterized protein n=1 Tax=Araneus ventricosus TaxID=182803 RepID=A0A4Y2SHE3_ARAVE|nr:hypothetical protein AVEN_143972-1 [Araneus ventricosus]
MLIDLKRVDRLGSHGVRTSLESLFGVISAVRTSGYGCPNPEVPRDLYSFPTYPSLRLLLLAASFHPSTASEGALHEELLPLCLLPASHGQPKPSRVDRA